MSLIDLKPLVDEATIKLVPALQVAVDTEVTKLLTGIQTLLVDRVITITINIK